MPYTVQCCEVTYLRILLYVMLGTWCDVPNITYNSTVDKLPHNIIRCKAYGIPNAQNKTCEMLNGS